jgi:2-C-methyl-D-erythritol 4-phosphate cytidylyltransferase
LLRDVGVVVVAAGQGVRAGGGTPKQFREVAGVPLVLHALRPFLRHPAVETVVLVLPGADAAHPPAWLSELVSQRLLVVAGGAARQESARAGLAALPSTCSVVVVHDGARPVVDDAVLEHVLAHARAGRGAIAAFPVSDTLKAVSAEGRITATVPRDGLWRAQTPQGFPRRLLERAYAAASGAATDEAALVESLGEEVVVVPDSPRNIKVTTPDDFALVDMILRAAR